MKFYFDNIWKHEHDKKKKKNVNKATVQNCILNTWRIYSVGFLAY